MSNCPKSSEFSFSTGPVKEGFQIISLGKAGTGKSHTGNTILGSPNLFSTKCFPVSVTEACDSKTATVNARPITYIDTPGFFDTVSTEHSLRSEILRSIIKCSQGPHAFLIILKAETYTGQEMETVREITESFGEDALNYAIVLFTHGDNLDEGQTIEDFVSRNQELQQLVDKCEGRCHVIDNRYWNHKKRGYRSNKVQVEKLLNTIENMVKRNEGGRYTNEMLQIVNREMQETEDEINRESNGRLSEEQIRDEAENKVHTELSVRLAGVATGVLLGALLGIPTSIAFAVKNISLGKVIVATKITATALSVMNPGTVAGVVVGGVVLAGAVVGGRTAYEAVDGEQTVQGAIRQAYKACKKKSEIFTVKPKVKIK
ncbi:GTPase IMAP family member 7-like [Paramisgurnus dabryanus]|uniref:GTPase IMAP family member 7-like n=1 Tax=Paramisgurnus dabryanus TaxID=90735 RepID=UPI003CCF128C